MGDTPDGQADAEIDEPALSERFLDVFVFLPTGLALAVADELPKLAERGRERFGVQVNSARAVGRLAVTFGHRELRKRSEGLRRPGDGPPNTSGASTPSTPVPSAPAPSGPPRLRTIPYPPGHEAPEATPARTDPPAPPVVTAVPRVDPHVPDVTSLAIPGFDTLSASQVVQRLDGLSRSELVAVRAYETSSRGRRTILSRVDQLMDERS
jgi:hypothetical protein